jgi:microcystin degradation protein MlrC
MRRFACPIALPSLSLVSVGFLLLGSCAPAGDGAPASYRVAVATFSHETCTFCPGSDVSVADWERISPPVGGDSLLRVDEDYIAGFVRMAEDYGDMELVGLSSPLGVFGGSSRPWNAQETFDHFLDLMIQDLEAALPVDGVYLALHGAMAVRGVPRPEAEIARRFREVVGPHVPIAASFDLHGNEDEEFLSWADFAFTTKRYPHYDAALQGARAARALHRTMKGIYVPTTATRKPGIITATVLQWTGASPSMDIMERARRWEAREADAFVSVFYGYPWSDVPDVGATIHVMTNDDQALADRIAEDMNEFFWKVREDFAVGRYPLPDDASATVAQAVAEGAVPVAVGDHSDRPGDATHILRAFEEAGIGRVLYGAISDPATLEALEAAGAASGDSFDREIGGFTPSGGDPYRIQGELLYFGEGLDYDKVAVVGFGEGNVVILAPTYTQVTEPDRFLLGPIRLEDFNVFVVKSRVHFRRGFHETGFAKTIVVVEAPGPFVGTTYLDALPYEHVDLSVLFPFGLPLERR